MGRNVYVKTGGGAPTTLSNWEGINFGDLKKEFPSGTFNNQRVQVRGTLGDLVDDGALIPLEGEVFIFCAPQKMAAGGYAEDKAYAKAAYAASDEGKSHFAGYPNVSADVLAELVGSFTDPTAPCENNSSEESVELTAVRIAVQGVSDSLDALGQAVIAQTLSTIGGITSVDLEAEYQAFAKRAKSGK